MSIPLNPCLSENHRDIRHFPFYLSFGPENMETRGLRRETGTLVPDTRLEGHLSKPPKLPVGTSPTRVHPTQVTRGHTPKHQNVETVWERPKTGSVLYVQKDTLDIQDSGSEPIKNKESERPQEGLGVTVSHRLSPTITKRLTTREMNKSLLSFLNLTNILTCAFGLNI